MEKEIKRTMKAMSIREKDNLKKLEFMMPMNIVGRHQILAKLKDLIIDIDEIIVKPVSELPFVIRKVKPFFNSDGYWNGNYIAYGTSVKDDKDILLWDDITIADMPHYETMLDTGYVKQHLRSDKPATVVVSSLKNEKQSLILYCYLP